MTWDDQQFENQLNDIKMAKDMKLSDKAKEKASKILNETTAAVKKIQKARKPGQKRHQHIKPFKFELGDTVRVVKATDETMEPVYLSATGKIIEILRGGAQVGDTKRDPLFRIEFQKINGHQRNELFWREELQIVRRLKTGTDGHIYNVFNPDQLEKIRQAAILQAK